MKRLVLVVLAALVAAGAGTAVARIAPAAHRDTIAKPRPTHSPMASPTPTPRIDATIAPSNGHHMVTGPNAVTERHVIHSSGSVGVVSGNVSFGSNEHGSVGTPTPKP